MRARQHLGRPGTAVIPKNWEANHGLVVAKTMPAVVSLRKPGSTETRNTETQQQEYSKLPAYATGQPARIQAHTTTGTNKTSETAEETVQVTGYLITLTHCRELEHEPAVGDLVDVVDANDQLVIDRTFRVDQIPVGSLRFERDLFCILLDQGGDLPSDPS